MKRSTLLVCFLALCSLFFIGELSAQPDAHADGANVTHTAHDAHGGGDPLPLWTVLPFAALLLAIAILPIASKATLHWWENNNNKLILALALGGVALGALIAYGWSGKVYHTLVFEYIPFVVLLGSLYYISGGIVLRGDIEATPVNNTLFLIVGTSIASLIGTTGASMLLIRPLLKTNSERKHIVHTVIFFIFLVSNIGGSLTPLGDPPLFLGYLQGVPFAWTLNLAPDMIFASVILLVIYYIWDSFAYRQETNRDLKRDHTQTQPISVAGQTNFIWLLGVVLAVAFINSNYIPAIKEYPYLGFLREAVMLLMVVLSRVSTQIQLRKENKFTLHPIQEVAYLFIGIFIAMIPALVLLEQNGKSLGVTEPWQFFWATGLFSSVLDNAPTYLTFLSLMKGLTGYTTIAQVLADPAAEALLKAISVGAVFMGANSYIGNAPNFMVKAVAEEAGVKMPSFGGYLLYSGGILIPIFILLTFVFFL